MPIEIRRKDVKTLVEAGRAQLVDVLPASQYEKEHLPHAVNIPLENMNAASTRSLRKEDAVIVYSAGCQCDISARAAWLLESMSFHEVYRYTPGKADWLAVGWQTEGTEVSTASIRQFIQTNVSICSLRERLADVKSRSRPNEDLCVVVNDRNIVLGAIQGDAWNASPGARALDIMQPGPRTIRPHIDPKEVREILRDYDAASVIVTTSDGELLGIVRVAQKTKPRAEEAA